MKLKDLNDDQRLQLKQRILTNYGTINDGKVRLGWSRAIQLCFATLQKEVYGA